MKKIRIKRLPDGKKFYRTERVGAVEFELQSKSKKEITFTSTESGYTYTVKENIFVYIEDYDVSDALAFQPE